MSTEPLLARLRRDGAAADGVAPYVAADDSGDGRDAGPLIAALRRAVEARDDCAAASAAWDEAGELHDPGTLDAALGALAPTMGLPFVTGMRRRRLREAARGALAETTRPGALRLAVAVIGAVGGREDAVDLELVAAHPAFTHHGATALANLAHREGRAALLRLLSRVGGAERVLVIDRLLPFVREPVVRLALVRDAFTGLGEEHAREIAPAVAETLGLRAWIDEPRTSEELRAAARRILSLAE